MLLIYSIPEDHSSSSVIEWLNHFQTPWIRINHLRFGNNTGISFDLSAEHMALNYNGTSLDLTSIKKVWLRRFDYSSEILFEPDVSLNTMMQITDDISVEKRELWKLLNHCLPDKTHWLNYFESVSVSKITQLLTAKKLGVAVPDTVIVSSKSDLIRFKQKHRKIIVKPLENFHSYFFEGKSFTPFTELVSDDFIDRLPDLFFPMLFQQYIEKEIEVRSFFLNGKFYSMAIFSQNTNETKIDFRNSSDRKNSRRIPYQLPAAYEKQLRRLMKKLNLNCGSFDIIKSPNGSYYFLEVNAVGQFGMTSHPCNYYLDKKIAEFLTA